MTHASFEKPEQEHRFAPFVRTLGKGKSGSRSLSRDEAKQSFGMILRNEAEAVQVGAFLMLLRVKEETAEELAGFVDACREEMLNAGGDIQADLDWPSYAGKKSQHPWYILAMLLLAGAGHRVLAHGADGHTPGRLYTEEALKQLGLPVANDWQQVAAQLDSSGFSYLPLRHFCRPLHELVQLRPLLGLRSPVNTLTRMLNPLRAPCSIQSIFHPAYAPLHQQADQLLGQPRAMVFKGEGGEVEIKPQADTWVYLLSGSHSEQLLLPRVTSARAQAVGRPEVEPLRALWRGTARDEHGTRAVIGTTALALALLQPGLALDAAQQAARELWQSRDTRRLD